jgi:hypothetical protein
MVTLWQAVFPCLFTLTPAGPTGHGAVMMLWGAVVEMASVV